MSNGVWRNNISLFSQSYSQTYFREMGKARMEKGALGPFLFMQLLLLSLYYTEAVGCAFLLLLLNPAPAFCSVLVVAGLLPGNQLLEHILLVALSLVLSLEHKISWANTSARVRLDTSFMSPIVSRRSLSLHSV